MKMKMKKINLLKTNLTILILFFTFVSIAQPYTKELLQEYSIDESKYFQIVNKFGEVHIENWEQNKLSINVTITVDSKSEEKANDFFEKVEITFTEMDTLISAITELKSSINNIDFSIDYEIFMPNYLRIDLTNSYGDVYIQELNGKSLMNIKYGTLHAEKLLFGETKPRSVLILSYSEGYIEECDWLKLKINFSEIKINKSEALIIKSKYSEIDIEETNSIVAESMYDQSFDIEAIENFVCTGEYSSYNIEKLSKLIKVDLKYSDLEVEKVEKNFTSLDITLKYANAEITIENSASYQLLAESEYGNIEIENDENLSIDSDKTENSVKGLVGTDKNTSSKIIINAKYSDVNLE